MATCFDDYRWLVSSAASKWIANTVEEVGQRELVAVASSLRQHLTAEQTHLVLEQVELRQRAKDKFTHADKMFFTRKGYQQSSGEVVATYKASRFTSGVDVVDYCCGIGGDAIALARRGKCRGIDRDKIMGLLSEANATANEVTVDVVVHDAETHLPESSEEVHLDPDRRDSQGRRSVKLTNHEPNDQVVTKLVNSSAGAAVKLAPAAEVPMAWQQSAELEWISHRGECKQLVAWFGCLAKHPGLRKATILCDITSRTTLLETTPHRPRVAEQIGPLVFEPDAAVLAARLTDCVATAHDLQLINSNGVYLTGESTVDNPSLATFEVIATLPFDVKRLKSELRSRGIGRLEIKNRQVRLNPKQLAKQLKVAGDRSATLLVTLFNRHATAILAHRLDKQSC